MATELRGKVRLPIWLRPTCMDHSDSFRNGQKAKGDFERDCCADGEVVGVVSHDVLADLFDDYEQPDYPIE